uniref:Uncharacterized protein n=1 Tax=Lepeophtheirus salmonis TaxID=72036 RepID=A0A0K2UYM4_LEPSM
MVHLLIRLMSLRGCDGFWGLIFSIFRIRI